MLGRLFKPQRQEPQEVKADRPPQPSKGKILLVDEPSLGLAPKLVLDVFRALEELHQAGVSILLVEQNVNKVLHITERCYVMEQGRIVLQGESLELLGNEHVRDVYLGMGEPAA